MRRCTIGFGIHTVCRGSSCPVARPESWYGCPAAGGGNGDPEPVRLCRYCQCTDVSGAVRYGAVAANLCSAAVADQGSGKRCGYLCVRSVFHRAGFCPPGAVLNHGVGGGGGSGAVRRLSGPVRAFWQSVCGYPEIYGYFRRRRQWGTGAVLL